MTSSASPRSCEAPYSQINWYIFSSLCVSVFECVFANVNRGACQQTSVRDEKKKNKVSVCLVIYDATSVINTALLSHLDALIDTCSGGAYGSGT